MTYQPHHAEDATLKPIATTPMMAAALFEQRVSFIFGQLGGSVSKERIREQLLAQGYASDQLAAAKPESPHVL